MPDFPPQVVAIPLPSQGDKFLILVLNPATNKLAVYKVDATAVVTVPTINNASGTITNTNTATYP
jgi:hypothetical protein